MNSLEAFAAKGLLVVSRAAGAGFSTASPRIVDYGYNRKQVAVVRGMEQYRAAYLDYVKATVAHCDGKLDAAGLQASREKLERALSQSEKVRS